MNICSSFKSLNFYAIIIIAQLGYGHELARRLSPKPAPKNDLSLQGHTDGHFLYHPRGSVGGTDQTSGTQTSREF